MFITANSLLHLHEAEDLVSCFRSVRRHLAPGARFVFDVFSPSVRLLAEADGVRRTRGSLSFTDPTNTSWINQIETFFGIITRQAIRRGDFRSVAHLIKKISDYIEHWNEDARPFAWSATASEILGKVALLDRDYRKLVANNVK